MSTVARQGRIFRIEGGGVPVSAAVAGVVELDGDTYGEPTLSDRQLLAHATSEVLRARQAGVPLVGTFARVRPARRARLAGPVLRGAA